MRAKGNYSTPSLFELNIDATTYNDLLKGFLIFVEV
jgi:hypothetical protein